MMPDALREQWRMRRANAPLHATMTFCGDALVLGAGTALAKLAASEHREGTADVASSDDRRLVALLSAAHGRLVTPRSLAHIRRAIAKRAEGETTIALIHLALSGLSKLERSSEGARRLFVADELMKAGIAPGVVVHVLGRYGGSLDELERGYNPEQPRVPAGSGRPSGQWTSGDGADAAATSTAASTDASAHLNRFPQGSPLHPNGPIQQSAADKRKKKDECIDRCIELALPTTDYGVSFQRCIAACMSDGNSGFPEWDKHF